MTAVPSILDRLPKSGPEPVGVSDDDLARMSIEGGLKGAADIAARLLRATFGEAA